MPFRPDPQFNRASSFRPDPESQSDKIVRLKEQSNIADKEAGKSLAGRFVKELPKEAYKTIVGNIPKFGISALTAPVDIARGFAGEEPLAGSFKLPGLDPQKTFQREAVEKFGELETGEGSNTSAGLKMAGELTKAPLAGLETGLVTPGIVKATKVGTGRVLSALERKISARSAAKRQEEFEKTIDLVAPKLSPKELRESLSKGEVKTKTSPLTKTITADFSDNARVVRIAEDTKDIVNPSRTASQNLIAVRNEIENKSKNVVVPFLEKNKVPFYFDDFINKLNLVNPSTSLVSSPNIQRTYDIVRERVVNLVANSMKKSASAKGDFQNMTDYTDVWNARKELDRVAEEQLKNFSFGSPEYGGVKLAVQDMRSAFKEFILDGLQYPGQMDKVNKMQEFIQVFRARGGQIPDDKKAIKILQEQFGIENTPDGVARMAFFRDQIDKMFSMMEAKTNLSAKTAKEIGTSALSRFGKKHPALTEFAKTTGYVIGGSAIGGALSSSFRD